MSYGQKRPFQPGRPIELRDGEATPRIDFTLPRGGVIAGRITDEYGEPIAGISVRAMRQGFAGGRKQLVPVSTASTDDRGQYRIYGLAASDYYVSAQTSDQGFDFARFESRDGFAPTYYPGTPSAAEAQKIRVPAGGEQSSVGFALIPARVCLVSGTVITSSGTPATQGFLMVQSGSPDDMSYTVTGGGMLRSDGSFTLSNLAPGDYVLRIGVGTEDDRESGSLPITVGGRDLTGLTLATTKPSPVSGQVLFESTPPESLRPGEFQFWMHPVMPTAMAWGGQLVTRDDWTLQGRASDGPLYVDAGRFPSGWMIKTVLLNGVDITETGFETRSGAAVDGLQVVLTDRLTRITGDVLDDLGRPARDYVVVIFPEDPARWHRFSRRQRAESADQQGRFEVSRLPPGRYLAVALDYLEVGEQEDREFLESMRAWATPVELHEGEAKTLALKLVSRP